MKLYTYDTLSVLLNIPKNTLYAMVHEGQIPCVRIAPRTVRFEASDIEEWLQGCRVPHGGRDDQ